MAALAAAAPTGAATGARSAPAEWNADDCFLVASANGGRAVYSHDLFAERALEFVRENKDRRFFFYGAFTIPHAEVTVPEDSLREYEGLWEEPKAFPGSQTYCPQDKPRAVRAAMITRLDRDIGRLLDLLDELGLAEDTLVVFSSDNGPITAGGQDPHFFQSAGPLRGLKFSLYEGGIRVPCLVRWPGRVVAGSVSERVSDFADLFPTLAELTGMPVPDGLDGVSILPSWLGQPERQAVREVFYWEAAPQQALRMGDWKLYRAAQDAEPELYHLGEDVGEKRDLAGEQAGRVKEMLKVMKKVRVDHPDFPLAIKGKKRK
jgi:arylsulfatase A-like enzyme